MKSILKSQAVVNTQENGGVFNSIGGLMAVIKDAQNEDIEDARVTKELFQKCQFIDLIILLVIFAGNMFCILAVRIFFKFFLMNRIQFLKAIFNF